MATRTTPTLSRRTDSYGYVLFETGETTAKRIAGAMVSGFFDPSLAADYARGRPYPDGKPYYGDNSRILWVNTRDRMVLVAGNWGPPASAQFTAAEKLLRQSGIHFDRIEVKSARGRIWDRVGT
jgi:hypothetical protein